MSDHEIQRLVDGLSQSGRGGALQQVLNGQAFGMRQKQSIEFAPQRFDHGALQPPAEVQAAFLQAVAAPR